MLRCIDLCTLPGYRGALLRRYGHHHLLPVWIVHHVLPALHLVHHVGACWHLHGHVRHRVGCWGCRSCGLLAIALQEGHWCSESQSMCGLCQDPCSLSCWTRLLAAVETMPMRITLRTSKLDFGNYCGRTLVLEGPAAVVSLAAPVPVRVVFSSPSACTPPGCSGIMPHHVCLPSKLQSAVARVQTFVHAAMQRPCVRYADAATRPALLEKRCRTAMPRMLRTACVLRTALHLPPARRKQQMYACARAPRAEEAHLADLLQVRGQHDDGIIKAQALHGPQQVIAIDCLAFFALALIACPARESLC